MKKISAIIIAKNEEGMIADCLDSVAFCDEIIVIDGESKDRTKDIAEKMGARVFIEPFKDFATARNTGLAKAGGEWVFYIDADERISPALQNSIKHYISRKEGENEIASCSVKRKNFYFGKHEWPYIEIMERLFKRNRFKGWYGKLHETPRIEGKTTILDGFLHHYTHRDLTSMLTKTIVWSTVEARLRFDADHPQMKWWRFPRVMIGIFYQSYISQKSYTMGTVGLLESMYQSFSIFCTYAKLWEMQQKEK